MLDRQIRRPSPTVAAWMSAPEANASWRPSSPDRCASIAQLDLAVVGHQQHLAIGARHERPPDLAADLRTHRDVLQVGVRAAEPPGRRGRLVEGACVPGRPGPDELRQRLEVGRVELVELAPRQQRVDDRMLLAELLQDARVGRELPFGRLLARLQPELPVQDLAKLRRRVQVELLARRSRRSRLSGSPSGRGPPRPSPPGRRRRGGRRALPSARAPTTSGSSTSVEQRSRRPCLSICSSITGASSADRGRLGRRAPPRVVCEQLAVVALLDPREHVGAQIPLGQGLSREYSVVPGSSR